MYPLLCGLDLYISKLNSPATLHASTASPNKHTHSHTDTHNCCQPRACLAASCILFALLVMSSTLSSTFPRFFLSFEMKFLYSCMPLFFFFLVVILTYSELFLLCAADFLTSCISEIPPVALSLTVKSFRAGLTFVSRSSIPVQCWEWRRCSVVGGGQLREKLRKYCKHVVF